MWLWSPTSAGGVVESLASQAVTEDTESEEAGHLISLPRGQLRLRFPCTLRSTDKPRLGVILHLLGGVSCISSAFY